MRISTQKVLGLSYPAPTPFPDQSWIGLDDKNISSTGNKSSHYSATKDLLHSIYWAPLVRILLLLSYSDVKLRWKLLESANHIYFREGRQASSPLVKRWHCTVSLPLHPIRWERKSAEKILFSWQRKPKSWLAAGIVNRSVWMEVGPVDAGGSASREWIEH